MSDFRTLHEEEVIAEKLTRDDLLVTVRGAPAGLLIVNAVTDMSRDVVVRWTVIEGPHRHGRGSAVLAKDEKVTRYLMEPTLR